MKKFLLSVIAAAVVATGVFAFAQHSSAAEIRDCDTNAIITCGALTMTELRKDFKANDSKDLPALYAKYGITADMINTGAVRMGTVYKNGDVKVDGEVVATDARSVGRHNMAGSSVFTINDKKFYERATSTSFVSNSIPAFVFFDGYGKYQAAILTACGNPVKAHPKPKPVYQCKALTASQLGRDEFSFKADAFARDATFKYITYTVKDSNGKVVKTIKAANENAVNYKATSAGTFSVEAVVTVEVNGKLLSAPVGNCKKSFTVKAPVAAICNALSATAVAGRRDQFTFTPSAKLTNATLKSVVYTVKNASGTTVDTINRSDLKAVTYTQAKAAAYSVSAVVTATADGKDIVAAGTCQANFTVTPEVPNPVYRCDSLEAKQLGDTSFSFATAATVQNATLKSVVYTVKDASGKVVKTITSTNLQPVTYEQTVTGGYTVEAIVTVMVGSSTVAAPGTCKASFTVKQQAVYECKQLVAMQVDRTNFRFATTVVTQNASLKTIVYTVKDQTGAVVDTITSTTPNVVNTTQPNAGTYTVTAVVTVLVNGQAVVAFGNCQATFTVTNQPATPAYECKQLSWTPVIGQKNTYKFAVVISAIGGATVKAISLNFGDATPATDVALDQANNIVHTYTAAGSYTAKATVSFAINGDMVSVQTVDCSTPITVNPDLCTVPGKETLPANSPDCYTPCELPGKSDLPATSTECVETPPVVVPPTTPSTPVASVLPSTGPGSIISLFSVVALSAGISRYIFLRRFTA